MKRTAVKNIENNIIYVEPNYINSTEEYDVNGLNVYEYIPPLEDYSIFVNLEVETRGRNVQSSKSSNGKKLILSFVTHTDGTSSVNFMQGSKIPIGDSGATINSLTTNYTDIYLGDLKKNGPSTELFGIKSIDIAYNSYMVPEVTIEFIDVRGVALFAQKEYYETNKNIDSAIDSNNKEDIANTFFQCFFTFPYPKFTLLVKGFYGQPVSYELTCADFRARFESSTGNFSCTAKFVGYHFSFLNDVMMNGIVAAPYSDYIGADYWASREFKLVGNSGDLVDLPKIGDLLNKMKEIEALAKRIAQSSPVAQEKTELDQRMAKYNEIEGVYNEYVSAINSFIGNKIPDDEKYEGEQIIGRLHTDNGFLRAMILMSPTENEEEFCDYVDDGNGVIAGKYEQLIAALEKYNEEFADSSLPTPQQFHDSKPRQRIFNMSNSETNAQMESQVNNDIKENYIELYNKFNIYVKHGNYQRRNPLLDYKSVYYYYDNKFAATLEEYKGKCEKEIKETEKKISHLEDDAISEVLKFRPTVENMTKIVMAHFETFAKMIYETSKTICNESPQRTIASLRVSDARDISDVKNSGKSSDIVVPPFPKVTSEVKRENSTIREESWVGDYAGDFREKDLVHGLINGVNEIAKYIQKYEKQDGSGNSGGSTTPVTTKTKFPLSPLDMIATSKPYVNGGFDPNSSSSVLGLVGLRAIQILSTTNFDDWDDNADALGKAEAYNFLLDNNISKELGQKLSTISEDDVFNMMTGSESGAIKKPGDGSKPWPWRVSGEGGIIDSSGNLDICRVKDNSFSVPYQNLSWGKIKNEVVNSPNGAKAMWSNDYINSKSYDNVTKENIFTFDTNVNRFSAIAEEALKGDVVDGLEYYQKKILDECKYDSKKYENYLTDKAKHLIAYIIEDADKIVPSDGSCMLPASKRAFANKSFEHGYNMDYFYHENPGDGGSGQLNVKQWMDKDGKIVKRKGGDGYDKYLENFNYRDFAFTEFPGLEKDLSIYTQIYDANVFWDGNVATSIFAQSLYYKESDARVRGLMFLASLARAIDYKKIIKDFICNKSKTMAVIPLPSVLFVGGLLWADSKEGKKAIKFINTNYYSDEIKTLLGALRPDVQRKFIKIFETWVNTGINTDSILRSFSDIRRGMELKLTRLGNDYDKFFNSLGEIEDKNIVGGKRGWFNDFNGAKYESLIDFFKGELSDDFFENYITVDEDVYGSTRDGTRGMRLGIRDGGPSAIHASNLALAGCVFSKNTSFFHGNSDSVSVNPGSLKSFFKGFLDVVKEQKYDETTSVSEQISQALDPKNSNTDIKVGIYRYCKMLYDKWIAGLSDEEFENQWTLTAFFEGTTNNDKYFYFIDAFYNVADFLTLNIGDFCDQIVSCYRSDQYSLLSFLSSVYAKNKFNFLCVQNFLDLGDRHNMELMFDTVPYTDAWIVKRHPNFIVMYPYESSNYLDIENGEYDNDGFMINQKKSDRNIWPEALTSRNANSQIEYTIPAFGVSYGKMYQSYFKDVDISMDSPTVTEQSIKAQFSIACQNNEDEQTGDRSKLYTYGQDLYSIYSNNSYTCNVTMMGCAWVQPLMYFVLNNIPMFRGTYLIEKVSHHIEPGNMITKFMGVRMSNVCTRIARENAIRARNDQAGTGEANSETPEIKEKLAGVNNDCPYKEYPLDGSDAYDGGSAMEDTAKFIKEREGGYSNHKNDKGGCTMKGITIAVYRKHFGSSKTCNDLRNITDEQWKSIFKKDYWDKWKADEIQNKSIAKLVVDWSFNSGCYGFYYPQDVLGTKRSCAATAADIKAINSYPNQRELFDKLWNRRKQHYIALSKKDGQSDFLKGWLNRLNALKYSDNPQAKAARNEDKHISDLAVGFLNALNNTAAASSTNVEIGILPEKCSGDTLWLTNAHNSDDFASVLDMIINTYATKVDTVRWVLPGDGQNYNSVPAAYVVHVKEGNDVVNISVVSENSPDTLISSVPVAKGKDVNGIHEYFCKALIKRYKSNTPQLVSDTNNQLDDYDALFEGTKYNIVKCDDLMKEYDTGGNGSSEGENIPSAGSNSTWAKAVETMGKWYEANVHTYQNRLPPAKGSGVRKMYECSLINGKVADDCSGYVSACLQYFGAFKKGLAPGSGGFTSDSKIASILEKGGFKKMTYSWSAVQPYDIISYNGHVEILAVKGEHPKSWGWGSVHDCNYKGNGRACMPAGTGDKPKGSTYKVIWRYVG